MSALPPQFGREGYLYLKQKSERTKTYGVFEGCSQIPCLLSRTDSGPWDVGRSGDKELNQAAAIGWQ